MTRTYFWVALIVLLCLIAIPCTAQQMDGIGEPKAVYVTTADYQYDIGNPMDSSETVKAYMESLKDCFNVDTIWWRGFQDDLVLQTHVLRPEQRKQYDWWMWVKHLNYDLGCNDTVARVGHDLGMKVWVYTALFDWGAQADAGFQVELPYTIEYKLRVEHPEYAPVNRYGTRLLGGPVEFCYPEVRKTVIKDLVDTMTRNNLDGLMFYTYTENMTLRYFDEFGFNKPIVDEYKRRYGVDILTQPYDKEKHSRLRGEYVTLFLKELRSEFKKRGMKLGFQLSPTDEHLPLEWIVGISGDFKHPEWQSRPAGHVYLDWEKWVKEGIVDEISVGRYYSPESEALLKKILAAPKKNNVKVSQWKSKGDMASSDVHRLMCVSGDELMSGFPGEANVDWGDASGNQYGIGEKLTEQPLSNLKSSDRYARRRVLFMLARDKQKAPLADVVTATKDSDVFARLLAVRALGVMKDPAAVPAIEEALFDPENCVRQEAVLSLAKNPGPASMARILDAMWRENSTWQFNYVTVERAMPQFLTAGKITQEDIATLLAKSHDLNRRNRRLAFNTLMAAGLSTNPEVRQAALKALKDDPDEYVQDYVVKILAKNTAAPDIMDALSEAVKEKGEATQVRAAVGMLTLARGTEPGSPMRTKALAEAMALFKEYGEKCTRSDNDWGWREVGFTIRDLGEDGRKALADIMAQRKDHRLADNAWQILYIKQERQTFTPSTAAEDAKAHAVRPKW